MKYNIGLLKIWALIFLASLLLNKFVFSKTARLYKDYRHVQSLEEQLARAGSTNPAQTPLPLNNENLISNERLVERVSQACEENGVSVKQYETRLLDSEGDYKLYTANLILSGNYIDLVKTLQYWEDNIPSIKISSLKFEYDEKRMKDKKVESIMSFRQVGKWVDSHYFLIGEDRFRIIAVSLAIILEFLFV